MQVCCELGVRGTCGRCRTLLTAVALLVVDIVVDMYLLTEAVPPKSAVLGMVSAVGGTASVSCGMLCMPCLLPGLLDKLCVLLSSSAQLRHLTQSTLLHKCI